MGLNDTAGALMKSISEKGQLKPSPSQTLNSGKVHRTILKLQIKRSALHKQN